MFITCVDDRGWPTDSDCFVSQGGKISDLPPEAFLRLASELGAPSIFITISQGSSLVTVAKASQLASRIRSAAHDAGLELLDLFLLEAGDVLSLRDRTDLWD